MNQIDIAREYIQANISVVPIRLDGSKAAAVPWKTYQERLASDEELQQWFSRPMGIGIVCGKISLGLEVFDFDDGSIFWPWLESIPDVACRLTVVETPKNGYHVMFRCKNLGSNQKIAMQANGKQVRIETRGEGGYIVGAGSPLGVHQITNRTYVQVLGNPLPELTEITPEERKRLFQVAARFDLRPLPQINTRKIVNTTASHPDSNPVIERFKSQVAWSDVLPGWKSSDGVHWTRPGKTFGVSASLAHAEDGTEILYVFTTSTTLKNEHCYNKFELFKQLIHNGDSRAAYAAAKEMVASV